MGYGVESSRLPGLRLLIKVSKLEIYFNWLSIFESPQSWDLIRKTLLAASDLAVTTIVSVVFHFLSSLYWQVEAQERYFFLNLVT